MCGIVVCVVLCMRACGCVVWCGCVIVCACACVVAVGGIIVVCECICGVGVWYSVCVLMGRRRNSLLIRHCQFSVNVSRSHRTTAEQ